MFYDLCTMTALAPSIFDLSLTKTTKIMDQLSQESLAYQSNGHYIIEGQSHYSIWTYKNNHGIQPNNYRANSTDSTCIHKNNVKAYNSKPDFGNFDNVFLFSEEDLDNYFNS
jgi:hypothetical protein